MTRLVRRNRHSSIVVSLLSLIFIGMGAVIGMMSRTTFRPLPFSHPESLVQYIQVPDGLADPWKTPLTVRQIEACLLPDSEHSDTAVVELWHGRLVALVESLLNGGIVDIIIVGADNRPALSLAGATSSEQEA